MRCDRCGSTSADVELRFNCDICGPTPLCDECHKIHEGEILIENQRIDPDTDWS